MAQTLAMQLDWPTSAGEVVQSNKVGHTRAKSFNRLVTPASFEGRVVDGQTYVLVDDHVGLGGTLANLKGFIETHGGRVAAMTTLTESRDARHIALQTDTLKC
jgi:adenine/guanine phosphoribosyltransferase-like PRPP-binding protein